MYWIHKNSLQDLIETDEDGRVVRVWGFREPRDLVDSVYAWMTCPEESRPELWDGEWLEQLAAEGAEEADIEATRDELARDLREYYEPCEAAEEIVAYMRNHAADHVFRKVADRRRS